MLAKLSAIALIAAPLAAALTLNTPSAPTSEGQVTISWDWEPTDPPFTIELTHPSFNEKFAIANNVDPAQGEATFTWPAVPAQDGYTLEAVNIGNINDVYATSPTFSIAANTNTAAPSSTASRPVSSAASSPSAPASVTTSRPAGSSSAGVSGSSGAPSSSASQSLTPLNGSDDGAASASVISGLGVLAAAVAGAVVAL